MDIWKALGPWGPIVLIAVGLCFFAGIGVVWFVVKWPQIKSFVSGMTNGSAKPLNDELIKNIVQQNDEYRRSLTKLITDHTAAMQQVAGALEHNGQLLDRNHRELREDLSIYHRRLDDILARRAA